ncbi:hypothetical protein CAPTEDRAFT_143594, partial [Capitella teleta]
DVRLIGGRNANEGRVEVKKGTSWGTVCDDGWEDVDARVVCRQLGFDDGYAVYPPTFPVGSGMISLADVGCSGDEVSLLQCGHSPGIASDCSHQEDAGARCIDRSSG